MNEPLAAGGAVLTDVLERNRRDEQRRALRALLARPLLSADDPAYPLVRRHADCLRQWLGRETGWLLQVESDFARLHKRVFDTNDGTRAARVDFKAGNPPFSRRRYCLLCLALAALERGENQTTLGRLGEAVMGGATDPLLSRAGIRFALDNREERRDLVTVVRLLLSLGVLTRVAGDEEAFVDQAGDVLYDVNRHILASLLVTTRGPSLIVMDSAADIRLENRLHAITETYVPETHEARNQFLRQRLTRRLLDDPVLYWEELSEEERTYLTCQRSAIARRIQEATGLIPEIRAEGLALVDVGTELTDIRLPAEGTEGHATLLLAEYLIQRFRTADRSISVTMAELQARMREWIEEYGKYWRKAARESGAEAQLCAQAIDGLVALRLAERNDDGVRPLPALGRFAVDTPTVTGRSKFR